MKAGVPGKLDSEPLRPNKRDIDWILSKMPFNFDRKNLRFVVTRSGVEGELKQVTFCTRGKPSFIELFIHPNDWTKLLAELNLSSGCYFNERLDKEEGTIGTICGIKVYSRTQSQTQALSSSEHNRPEPTQP